MIKNQSHYFRLTAASFLSIILFSCNYNSGEIAFPENELGYSQPVSVPLQFTAEKKLVWDTAKQGGIKSAIKKLDINTLPSAPYDSSGFKPFAQAPEEVHFDFSKLPEADFKMVNLTSIPLQFKTSVLAPPAIIKASAPTRQKANTNAIFDFGQLQGLQAKFVTCLLRDKSGLMWIASREGLFRYDGERLKVYIQGPLGKFINGMVEDNNGNIWFTQEGSFGMIDLRNGIIHRSQKIGGISSNLTKMFKDENGLLWVYNHSQRAVSIIDPVTSTYKNLDKKAGLSDSSAFEIQQDADKNIWITTYTGGVDIIDLTSGKIKYLKKTNGLSSDTLSAMTMDKKGRVWLCEPGGILNAVDIKNGSIQHYKTITEDRNGYTFYLAADKKDRIWKGSANGLEIIDTQKGIAKVIRQDDGLSGNTILSCTEDYRNRMWIATTTGLNIIDNNGEMDHPLPTTNIVCLMNDDAGNLWVGTQKGIKIIDAKKNTIRTLDKSNGLGHEFVQSFTKFDQQMWVATNGGLDVIDPVKKTIEHTGKNEGMVVDQIYAVFKDRTGNTWITGPTNGIDVIDSAKKMIRNASAKGGLNDDNISDVKQDQEGLIWLATNLGGADIINLQTGTVKYLNNQPGLKDTCNRLLLLDQNGRIWIGTDKGIYVVDKKNGTITPITTKQGLSGNQVVALQEYKGSVIAGINSKINIITPPANGTTDSLGKKWKISVVDKSESLLKETNSWNVDCITKTGEYLWGDKGITIINEIKANTDSVVTHITGMNVMTQPMQFVNNIELNEKDTLWTADTFYIKGQQLPKTGYAAAKEFNWDSVSGPYNMPVNLNLPFDNNYIQFQFAQVNLGRQDTTWYTYILEGIDKKWSAATTNTFTENYLNLPPGKYTFKASSKGINGQWSIPATFSFTISPPWYQTWWAYTLFALIGIGILRAYIVYRSRMLTKENRILEEKVNLRTEQLQKSLEDLKATQTQLIQSEKMASLGELTAGIAHEIQNPLNFINNFSEVNAELITEMKEEIEKGNLEEVKAIANDIAANEVKITHHGKRADGIVKGMLQHSRTGNRQKEPTDINALADEYLRLAYHGLRAKDKSFNATMETDFDEKLGEVNIITQDIGRVILNLITNAFYAVSEKKKLQPEGYEPTVSVSTKKLRDKISITVKDNGNGIPQKVMDKIFQPFFTTKPSGEGTGLGLSLSYDIVKAHNGELKVETKEGEGAEFIIILPQ